MTTSVKVTAHCSAEKQVRIIRQLADGSVGEHKVIQDGETHECVVYDGWSVTANEELKTTSPADHLEAAANHVSAANALQAGK